MAVDAQGTGLKILCYGGGWPTNIGNAFIDLGVTTILRSAFPQAAIGFASEMPRFFLGQGAPRSRWSRLWQNNPPPNMDHGLDIASVTRCDLVVFGGMAMCETSIREIGPSLLKIAQRKIPILMLGCGAELYTPEEKDIFGRFLRQLKPLGFISRDEPSYEMFAGAVPNSHRGIDCGFFVSEAYQPFPLDLPAYVAVGFDAGPAPRIEADGRRILYAHHQCAGNTPEWFYGRSDTLISDLPQDYLTLYANAEEIHSDRVHACVAGLAYGRKARLYHPTPRGALFEAVNVSDIHQRLVQADMELLRQKKQNQIALVRQLVQSL